MPVARKHDTEAIRSAGESLGRDRGRAAGSWIIDGNTSEDEARAWLTGIADCDPVTMDAMPNPLSGEWAGESIGELISESGLDQRMMDDDDARDRNDVDVWMDAYEVAYSEAFWLEVERAARIVAGEG